MPKLCEHNTVRQHFAYPCKGRRCAKDYSSMSAKITTAFGYAVPSAPRHAVTVHMPGWQTVEKYSVDPRSIIMTLYNVYPRAKPHRDIAEVRPRQDVFDLCFC